MITSFTWVGTEKVPSATATGFVPEIPTDGWIWLDLTRESPELIRDLCGQFNVPAAFIDDALEEGSLPMLEEHRDVVYVVLNAFTSTSTGRLVPGEIDLFIGPNFLISISDGNVVSTSLVVQRFQHGVGLTAPSPAGLVAHLAAVGSRRFPGLIDQLESELDSLEELALHADPRALTEVYALRRDLIVLRRVIVPQRQIFEDLAEDEHPLLDKASRREFERVADYQSQILESLEAARSLLGSVLEAHRGAVADQTNQIVRVLTVFSAILLPLALITGIFGMNFIELPLADHPQGFWITIGVMAVIALALWLYFARRRFVGTPQLSDLPRAVGLGIYQVGTAPIKAVAGGIESTFRLVTGSPPNKVAEEEGKPPDVEYP